MQRSEIKMPIIIFIIIIYNLLNISEIIQRGVYPTSKMRQCPRIQ